tara:strand:- start:781 stop:1044 length:264 start_codon:yes stop_codon:yes gene_type:complete
MQLNPNNERYYLSRLNSSLIDHDHGSGWCLSNPIPDWRDNWHESMLNFVPQIDRSWPYLGTATKPMFNVTKYMLSLMGYAGIANPRK